MKMEEWEKIADADADTCTYVSVAEVKDATRGKRGVLVHRYR